ncbi:MULTISPECIES: efflux RND transporter permease subunit [unclassified Devosia]|uniref:efflux RND transporter permease subunit n=1 Tax=unclassified Devosia TaxID=196773 RepID=UPI00145E6EE9|nr:MULTISPECIES: efflux RND transporter permease subunit [unclassified Devosia]MBJ6987566.1 efflux RND transporter permease subunit [Devosia sp. MC521]MBK1794030.1 efflux RND transporter permease subunit [Devosia sp. WQ 349K1]QMW61919.1 efflux RND transporter permease subunit [Devosia sp. MC521]
MSIEKKNERGGALATLFVKRPVLAIVINALIVVAGLAALLGIEVRELPRVEQPVLSISTSFPGAAAETVDREITAIVEGAVARVQGVTSISSSSSVGQSRVTLEFSESTNLDTATSDVRDALSRAVRNLPDDANEPTIFKADSDAQAVIQLAVTSDNLTTAELSTLVDDIISERLAAVDGVAEVQVYGTRTSSFEIDVDPIKLASRGLTVADVRAAVSTIALDTPAGSINGPNQNIAVRAISEVTSPADFEKLPVGNNKTLLGDVATVVFDAAASTSSIRADGRPGIGLGIVRQAQSNAITISEGVHAAVATLNETLPAGVTVKISSDEAVFIKGALHEVEIALIVALVVVIAIIFLFLLDWRATIVPAISMPIALLGAVAGMYAAGFSLNILTLLALVLATGLVVDDSIVVLENIVRRKHMGAGPRAAAVLGTQEVFFAVVATTLTLAAVFVPLSFLDGQTGRLFREFGFTLAIAVLLSSVVALTMGPMVASRLLKSSEHKSHGAVGKLGGLLAGFYRRSLRMALNNPLVVIVIAALFAVASVFVFTGLRQEITPPEDRSMISVNVSAPNTASLDFVRTRLGQVEAMLTPYLESGEATSLFVLSGWGNGGFMTLTLADWKDRERSQAQIATEINGLLAQVPGVRGGIRQGNSLGIRGGGSGLQFAVAGSDYAELAATAQTISKALEEDGRFGRVTVGYDTTQPQLTLTIDRQRADALGIDINGLAATMQAMIDGSEVGSIFINDTSYSVRMVSTTNPVNDPKDLESLFVKTGDGRFVPISTIATITEAPVPPSLRREEQRRAVNVTASLEDGLAMGDAYAELQRIATPLLENGQSILPMAEAKTLGQANNALALTFGFALIIILLVLAAQFESFWSAIIVMTTVPLGVAAGIYSIQLTGGSSNIFAQIGLVLIVGIMAKNGILIVEFANQLRDRGMSVNEAIEEASNIRLRPVLMTMIATILGGVPLVVATGAGAEARAALGWVIVGGLSIASVATLYLTPVAYKLLARFSKPKVEEEARLERELDEANDLPEPTPAE